MKKIGGKLRPADDFLVGGGAGLDGEEFAGSFQVFDAAVDELVADAQAAFCQHFSDELCHHNFIRRSFA